MRILLATIAGLGFTASAALACDYVGFNSAAEQAAAADIIFRGRAIETRVLDGTGAATTTFEVVDSIKMPERWSALPERIEIRHGTDPGMCGIAFPNREEALVIGTFLSDGHLYTGEANAPRWPESEYRAALHLAPD